KPPTDSLPGIGFVIRSGFRESMTKPMPMVRHITAIWRTNDQIGNQSGVRAASQLSVRPYGRIRVALGILPV
ncbi:hypothetical protein LIQ27_23220, partial [Bacteroides fragilis]|nr:hypothetical protein [Bacteroides fragilis]